MSTEDMMSIKLKDIALVDYTLIKLSIEALNLDKEEVKERISLGYNVLVKDPKEEDGKPKSCDARLQFSIKPVEQEAPYKIEGIIDGTFIVRGHNDYSDEEIVDYVQTRGIEELYVIAKSLIGALTAVSAFGTYILPEITVKRQT